MLGTQFLRRSRAPVRNGVECVEVAMTLPVFLIVVFATVELTHHWHVEKMLKIAAYEAMKAGADSSGTADDAIQTFEQHTTALGIVGAELELDESSFDLANPGEMLSCRGIAPTTGNKIELPFELYASDTITGGWVYYRKEGF